MMTHTAVVCRAAPEPQRGCVCAVQSSLISLFLLLQGGRSLFICVSWQVPAAAAVQCCREAVETAVLGLLSHKFEIFGHKAAAEGGPEQLASSCQTSSLRVLLLDSVE